MKPLYVIDASTAVAGAFRDPPSEAAWAIFNAASNHQIQLVAPELWELECGNAFWKRVRRRSISDSEAREGFELLMGLPITRIDTEHLQPAALDIGLLYGITTYDALYVATAMFTGGTLVTADRKLSATLLEQDFSDVVHTTDFRVI